MTRSSEQGVTVIEIVIVIAVALVITAMAVPTIVSVQRNYRAISNARNVTSAILLAKMRAASDFTQTRVYFDTSAQTFRLELWDKTSNSWQVDNPSGTVSLSQGITFGYGAQSNPPPNTQASIAQAGACYPGSGTSPGGGTAISNSACIVFNSRGIPIDPTTNNSPTGNNAIYITDGSGVYASTVSATGLILSWRIDMNDSNAAHWQKR